MSDLLQHGIEVFKSGNREDARKIFISFIKKNPQSESGWGWMYNVSQPTKERIYCLQQILQINPANKKAKELLNQLLEPSFRIQAFKPEKNRTRTQKNSTNILTAGAFAAFFMLGFCVVLAAISIQFMIYNETGTDCFFLSLKGKQFCYPSQEVNQAASNPVFSVPPVFRTDMPISSVTPIITLTPTVNLVPALTFTPTASLTLQATFTSTNPPLYSSDTRLIASNWRNWPIVPEFSVHAQQILREAAKNSNLDAHTFSKVGDCQMVAGIFLAGYANGEYSIPEGMYETVQWFHESMIADNITAMNGFGINTVLDPAFGFSVGYSQCSINEIPLDCELRTRHPMAVLIGMGTNWIPNAEVSFEKYLREIVDKVLETGALPILATKADNVEGNWKLNEVIAQVAYDYDLPLVNVWLSVQDLPNHGLEKLPRQVYLTGDGWMTRNHAWLITLDKVHKILLNN